MALLGTREVATHALSLVFALLCIPAAWWAGATLFGPAAAFIAAVLAALDPFLADYADETRMYALVVLLGIVATAAFLQAFALRRRRYVPAFALALTLLLYTHGWAVFLAAGAAGAAALLLALRPDRRRVLVDSAVVVVIVAALFAPWIPTVLFQAAHTGAPWSLGSTWRAAYTIPDALFGPWIVWVPLLGAAAAGLVRALRDRRPAAPARALLAGVALRRC
jgi:mannosyltransferase